VRNPLLLQGSTIAVIVALSGLLFSAFTSAPAAPRPAVSRLKEAPPRCMVPPKDLADVKVGDDLYKDDASVSAAYVDAAGKLVCVQGYVRTLRK